MKSERGYTLVLVMIIITITMIFALALSAATITSSKQFHKTDNRTKATDLAEMGITYYQLVNRNLIASAQQAAETKNTSFCTEFKNKLNATGNDYYLTKEVENANNAYLISSPTITCPDSNNVKVDFFSTGEIVNNEEVKLKGGFTITKNNKVGQQAPKLADFLTGTIGTQYNPNQKIFYGDFNENLKQDYLLNNIAWFGTLTLRGNGNEDHSFTINNDGIFTSISMNGHTILTINGDAIFTKNDPIDKYTNKADLCIKGDTYYVDSKGVLQSLDISAQNNCSNFNGKWSLLDNNISVIYNP